MRDEGRRAPWRLGALAAALLTACLALPLLGGCSGGWGAALQSVVDRVLPNPVVTMWARTPEPDAFTGSYADATGAGTNYVYRVEAVDEQGNARELQIIAFGAQATGEGYLEIEAKGGTGAHYRAVEAADMPTAALSALGGEA